MKFFKHIFVICVVTGSVVHAQSSSAQHAVATITASATVVGNLDLIVMRDLEFEIASLSPTELIVDPQKNQHAGEIKIIGSRNSLVRLTFETQSVLRHESGQSLLYFTNNLSGSGSEVQRESILLTQNNQIRLNDRGMYYVWVGGRLSGLENVMPGNYDMELTVELEYIQ
jgi:hypothetical protein